MNETATVVVVFCDLVESTALMTAVGDDAADRIRREMFTKWRVAIADADGSVVKTAGDGFMAVFPTSAGNAIRAADSLRAAMQTIDSPRPLRLRVGIAAGEVLHEGDDWFGTPVVEAARLCAAADPDEVLLSDTARKLIGSRGGYEFTAVGSLTLKGLAHPLPTYALGLQARKRRDRTPRKWIAVAIGVALVVGAVAVGLAAIDGSDGRSAAPVVPKPLGYTPMLTDRPCTPDESAGDPTVRCQTLTVPEDRSKPKGRKVRLAVVRAPATDAHASATPTISIGIFTASEPAGDPLRSASTLIRLGLRGRGDSTPLVTCPELDASRAARLRMRWSNNIARVDDDLAACLGRLRRSGMDISQYDDGDIADDVRDLAFALKLPQISLRASSDSARAAVVVMRRYPGLLRAVLMNNANVPPVSNIEGVGARYDQSLSLLARRCQENTACRRAGSNGLVAGVDALRAHLAADPQVVTVPTAAGPTDVLVDGDRFMFTLSLALGADPDVIALIASAKTWTTRDLTPVAGYLTDILPDLEARRPSDIVEWCAEDAGQFSKAALEAEAELFPRWRSRVDPGVLDVCKRAGVDRVPELTTPPASSIPVFMVEGALTPWGPSRALSEFGAGLTRFSLLTLPNEGRNLDNGPPCAEDLRVSFLRDPTTHLDTKKCEAADPPLAFALR